MEKDRYRITRRRALAVGGTAIAGGLAFPRRWVTAPHSTAATTSRANWPLVQGGPSRAGHQHVSVSVSVQQSDPATGDPVGERLWLKEGCHAPIALDGALYAHTDDAVLRLRTE